jgi:hypothetical protein
MLQCKDVTEETSNYIAGVEGGLPLSKRIALFMHLVICRCCRNYVQQFRQTIDTVTVAKPQEMDATDRQALAKKLHAMCDKTNPGDH